MTAGMETPARGAVQASLRPAMLAFIRTQLTGDAVTGVLIEGPYDDGPARTALIVLAAVSAALLREACGGDEARAVAMVDDWLCAAQLEVAELLASGQLPA